MVIQKIPAGYGLVGDAPYQLYTHTVNGKETAGAEDLSGNKYTLELPSFTPKEQSHLDLNQRVKRIAQNALFHLERIDGSTLKFSPYFSRSGEFDKVCEFEIPENVKKWLCCNHSRILYSFENTLFIWKSIEDGAKPYPLTTAKITCFAEMNDSILIGTVEGELLSFKDGKADCFFGSTNGFNEKAEITSLKPINDDLVLVVRKGQKPCVVNVTDASIAYTFEKSFFFQIMKDNLVGLKDKMLYLWTIPDLKEKVLCDEIEDISALSASTLLVLKKDKIEITEFNPFKAVPHSSNADLKAAVCFDTVAYQAEDDFGYSSSQSDSGHIKFIQNKFKTDCSAFNIEKLLNLTDGSILAVAQNDFKFKLANLVDRQKVAESGCDFSVEPEVQELTNGSIALKTSSKIHVMRLVQKSLDDDIHLQIAKLRLDIQSCPEQLGLYAQLGSKLQGSRHDQVQAYIAGMLAAMRMRDEIEARRFYSRIIKLHNDSKGLLSDLLWQLRTDIGYSDPLSLSAKNDIPQLLAVLKTVQDIAQQGEMPKIARLAAGELTFAKAILNKCVEYCNKLVNIDHKDKININLNKILLFVNDKLDLSIFKFDKPCKQRLFVGEGMFRGVAALVNKHYGTHTKLAEAITATELGNRLNTAPITALQNFGMKIAFGIDGTKIHESFKGKRFERIHWNCPFGGPTPPEKNAFKKVIPAFFLSASKLQLSGDRVHVTLADSSDYRQIENPIVQGSTFAGYRLIAKRAFGTTRYPDYQHNKTGSEDPFLSGNSQREFVFEKSDALDYSQHVSFKLRAQSLCDPKKKHFTVQHKDESTAEEDHYFVCSTDGDSSDYYESD